MNRARRAKAICMLSGGLDSMLAICVLREQGVLVRGITFTSPFFGSKNAERAAGQLRIPVVVMDITEEHLELVKRPPHGYGKYMNPCIDCHALMVKKAGEIMRSEGFDLVATGEVLGERPMSQNRQALDIVARESGLNDLLLRPLSAKLLDPTRPELEGLVDREGLLAIEGRSRKPQMELAAKYGITSYVQPAGGCLLTDPAFSARLRELLRFDPEAGAEDVRFLRLGRHFRLPSGAKVIVGRDERDNARIAEAWKEEGVLIESDITPGPTAVIRGKISEADVDLAARICASFADHEGGEVDMALRVGGEVRRIRATPAKRSEIDGMRI